MSTRFNQPLPAAAFRDTDEFPVARTAKGLALDKYLGALRTMVSDPTKADEWKAANDRIRNLTPGTTTTVQILQDLSVMYANDEFIGSRLVPEYVVPTSKGLGLQFWKYPKRTKFHIPDTTVNSEGAVNQVSEGIESDTATMVKRALKEFLDSWDESMFDSIIQDMIDPMLNVLDGMALKRESAQATVLCTSSNYGTNTSAPSITWNSPTGGNPGKDVDAIKASIWRGTQQTRLVAFTSWDVHRILKRHPVILDTFKYGGNAPMQATREMLAAYFEVDDYLVGYGQYDAANENQSSATWTNLWSNVFGLVRVAARPSRRSASFGTTFVQSPTQLTWFENGRGGKGGYWTQAADADVVKVVCSDCGYLLTTVLT